MFTHVLITRNHGRKLGYNIVVHGLMSSLFSIVYRTALHWRDSLL